MIFKTLLVDEYQCLYDKQEDEKIICKIGFPPIEDKYLPTVSIVTYTENNADYVPLMVRNWESIDYPRNKLEWVIVDNGPTSIGNRIKTSYPENVNYINIVDSTINYGKIMNFMTTISKNEYIVCMNDNYLYNSNSVATRIKTLLSSDNKKCVGSTVIQEHNLVNDFTYNTFFESDECMPAILDLGTLCYEKNFWKERKFLHGDIFSISYNFIMDRLDSIIKLNSIFVGTRLFDNKTGDTKINKKLASSFTDTLNMKDNMIIQTLRVSIIKKFPLWEEAIKITTEWDSSNLSLENTFTELEKLDLELRKNPVILNFIRKYRTKSVTCGNDVVIYCGPGKYKFDNWNFSSLTDSQENINNIAKYLVDSGYSVTLYCDISNDIDNKVKYRPYYKWLPLNREDVTIIHKDPTIMDTVDKVDSNKIILDLYDIIGYGIIDVYNFNYVFTRSEYHKQIICKNYVCSNFKVVPSCVEYEYFLWSENKNRKSIVLCEGEPKKSLKSLVEACRIINNGDGKNVEFHWICKNDIEPIYEKYIENVVSKVENFYIHLKPNNETLDRLYSESKVFAIGTRYPEVEYYPLIKAFISGCIPALTPNSCFYEFLESIDFLNGSSQIKSDYSGDNLTDYSISTEREFNKWVNDIVDALNSNNDFSNFYKKYSILDIGNMWMQYIEDKF